MVDFVRINFKRGLSIFMAAVIISLMTSCKEKKQEEQVVQLPEGSICEGISVGGVDIGGLSLNEASEKLSKNLRTDYKLFLELEENKWEIPFKDIEASVDYAEALNTALEIGSVGTDEERLAEIKLLKEEPLDIHVTYVCNETLLKNKLEEIDNELKESKSSFKMDTEQTADKIIKCLMSGEISAITPVAEKLDENWEESLIGSFSTSFSAGDKNRNENLRVACEKINGTVLESGDIFDMNEALGPQTAANGYKAAGAIENGKIVSAIGGGVCQVTTTIYNAAIFAELEIVERHNHSLMVGYVPLGRDAAVAGSYKNLRFKNDTDYPVRIETYLENNNIICNIYGYEVHDADRKIDFERVWISTISKPAEKVTEDPNLPMGEREITYSGKTGAKIDTYKLIYDGDTLLSREWFSSSTYISTADEVRVGTKLVEEQPTEDEPSIIGDPNAGNTNTEPNYSGIDIPLEPVTPNEPMAPNEPATPNEHITPNEPVTPNEPDVTDDVVIGEPDSSQQTPAVNEPEIYDDMFSNNSDFTIG
ncbi:vancomycin B-type resistance protein VanW [Clostridiales bacterium]|nr:vancomycin B-type resistance protein VanW [Clostridiales bacterium]